MEPLVQKSRSFRRRERRKKQEQLQQTQNSPAQRGAECSKQAPDTDKQKTSTANTPVETNTSGLTNSWRTAELYPSKCTNSELESNKYVAASVENAGGSMRRSEQHGQAAHSLSGTSGSAKRRRRKARAAANAATAEPAASAHAISPVQALPATEQSVASITPPAENSSVPNPDIVALHSLFSKLPNASSFLKPVPAAPSTVSETKHTVTEGDTRSIAEATVQATDSVRSRRETSPVISSTEEVLHSIRALQAVLGDLRAGLLEAPIRESTCSQMAPPSEAAPPAAAVGDGVAAAGGDAPSTPPSHPDAEVGQQKTKEQIKAERKAKAEAAKAAKAAKAKEKKNKQQESASTSEAPNTVQPAVASMGGTAQQHATGPSPGAEPVSKQTPVAAASKQVTSQSETPDEGDSGNTDAAPEKSKAELKAERRAKQEAQRAAKAAAATAKATAAAATKAGAPAAAQKTGAPAAAQKAGKDAADKSAEPAKAEKKNKKALAPTGPKKGVQMFAHLPQFDAGAVDTLTAKHHVHPSVLRLCLRLSRDRITDSNAGAAALLTALADVVDDYVTPAQKELRRDLPELVRRAVGHVGEVRPLTIAMENVAAHLDRLIRYDVPEHAGDSDAKRFIIEGIESFIRDNICKAMTAITQYAEIKISDNDVILVYGRCTTVLDVLTSARRGGRRCRAIVVDSRPRLDGRLMLQELLDAGVPATYGLLSAVSHLMKEATMVLLGADAMLNNGAVLAPAGSALVGLTGNAANKPVLVCCETYKFSERVQTDSQVFNQLGDPDALVSSPDSPLSGWRDSDSLTLLNLAYDVTPSELVDVVFTELGAIPCTSVPAVLRLQQHAQY